MGFMENFSKYKTISPQTSPLGAYLFFMLFGWRLIQGEGLFKGRAYSRGGLIR